MTFDLIFVSAFVLGWLACGILPWFALSVVTRGHAGMGMLPLCLLAAVVAGISVPLLGPDDETGLALSFSLSLAVPVLLLAARRLALSAGPRTEPATPVVSPPSEVERR
jgi:hypothetical protein